MENRVLITKADSFPARANSFAIISVTFARRFLKSHGRQHFFSTICELVTHKITKTHNRSTATNKLNSEMMDFFSSIITINFSDRIRFDFNFLNLKRDNFTYPEVLEGNTVIGIED